MLNDKRMIDLSSLYFRNNLWQNDEKGWNSFNNCDSLVSSTPFLYLEHQM